MNSISNGFAAALIAALVAGCAGSPAPKAEDMTPLGADEISAALADKTIKARLYSGEGTWWKAHNADLSGGVAKASGSGWKNQVTYTSTLTEDGQLCSIFIGEFKWSKPELEYCSRYLIDDSGAYYEEVSKNLRTPEQVGRIRPITLLDGDPAELIR